MTTLEQAREFKQLYTEVFEPTVALEFQRKKDFEKALEIATEEDIRIGLPGRDALIVPAAWVPLFDALNPKQIPIGYVSDLPPEEAAEARRHILGFGDSRKPSRSPKQKKARIAKLEQKLGIKRQP